MKIKSNATQGELSSPFYTKNKEFCFEFEKYIASKNGKVKGTYNAWSYFVYGKIVLDTSSEFEARDFVSRSWDVIYKKATFTSGNLLLSSKYQNLLVLAEWKTKIKNETKFKIRKKVLSDSFKMPFFKSLSILEPFKEYVVNMKGNKSKLLLNLVEVLKDLFDLGEIYKIECNNDKLVIELRTGNHHFDILNNLMKL